MVIALFILGVVFLAAAVLGGGLRAGNIEVPVISNAAAGVGLAVVGILAIGLGVVAHHWDASAPTPTAAAPTFTSTTSGKGSSESVPGSATPGVPAGTQLAHYTVDVPRDYGITFNDKQAQPFDVNNSLGPNGADLVVWVNVDNFTTGAKLARLDALDPDYRACLADTRFTQNIDHAQKGLVGCFTGHGAIAGFKVLDIVSKSAVEGYTSFDVTVWKAP